MLDLSDFYQKYCFKVFLDNLSGGFAFWDLPLLECSSYLHKIVHDTHIIFWDLWNYEEIYET